jgi:hypothetical protein
MAGHSPITIARLWAKVKIPSAPRHERMCWLWSGSTAKGYGQMKVDGKVLRTHRVAYEAFHGPIPEDMHILHSCDNPLCVNPAHLRAGTMEQNMADMAARNRAWRGGPRPKLRTSGAATED